jgi:hypothetical protein
MCADGGHRLTPAVGLHPTLHPPPSQVHSLIPSDQTGPSGQICDQNAAGRVDPAGYGRDSAAAEVLVMAR